MPTRLLQLTLLLTLLASSGCELIADFDRSKIPGNNPDASLPFPDASQEEDSGRPDATTEDAAAEDAGQEDASN